MHRRTFLASVPAVTLGGPLLAQQASANEPASKPAPASGTAPDLPPKWASGEDRFIRPDVGPGDRPVGASFASRTAVYGTSGAAGTAHPLATMAGIDILKRGGSA
ncbi:MAG: gamma-glutamyltransferase, partial [Lysobacterales bacterium]